MPNDVLNYSKDMWKEWGNSHFSSMFFSTIALVVGAKKFLTKND